ncbi:MAG: type 2 lantipeptide synthetase LanM, partial [Caldilineaceae bacterium]|nr:type 2 lantipeptide synthetase LanM [Caldilineaceae bacterium]
MSVASHPSPALAATWFQALSLAERAAVTDTSSALDRDAEDAAGYWARWRDQPPFDDDDMLAQRLAHLGLDLPRFRALLNTPAAALQTQHTDLPPWLADLLTAYADPITPLPEPGDDEYGFLEVARPLIDRACAELDVCVDELVTLYPELPFDPATIDALLLENLLGPLLMRLGRTMVLELNVARLLDQLDGDTAEARFHSFIARLQDPTVAQAILADYPVLARQLALCIDQWRAVSDEFLRRLCADWPDLCRLFSPAAEPGPLVELVGGAGDTHRGGRAVMIAEFASGLRVVYKPKSLAVDRHFQELLVWLNAHGCEPPLQPLTVLDRHAYGWVEFVAHRGCRTRRQVTRYYRRLGAYLALLYAINASDFHLENLIAAGEQPILIDLETLFNPEFERFDAADAGAKAAQRMLDSVLVVGMLPQRLWSDDAYGGIDISGLGGEEGQLSPDRLPMPDAVGTDEMRYVRARTPLAAEANRPMLGDVV